MIFDNILKRSKNKHIKDDNINDVPVATIQTMRQNNHPYSNVSSFVSLGTFENKLYEELRFAVPIIDACIQKLIRLTGMFSVTCKDLDADKELQYFLKTVPVSGTGRGIRDFLYSYLDSLICYGNAVGEIVLNKSGDDIYALYNTPIDNIQIKRKQNNIDTEFYLRQEENLFPIKHPELILFSALNPKAGQISGDSMLKGLPFVSNILLNIFNSIGQNFERVGNVRFAVTYKPSNTQLDKSFAKERALLIAKEWSQAMRSDTVKDFISVGDVDIKVIGADSQVLETNIPVRHMLEQIVAKMGIPPFLLGLNWSTSERMSSQQSDMLTSELESYQSLLNPIIYKICCTFLRMRGFSDDPEINWQELNLQDQVEGSKARLNNAKAIKIETELKQFGVDID